MQDHRRIGRVDHHVQALPDPRRQERQPEIMTGHRHDHQHRQREQPEQLERETDDLEVTGVRGEQRLDFRHRGKGVIPVENRLGMVKGHQGRDHPEMPPVVQERQKPPVDPRQRADGQHDAQQQKRAAAKGAHPVNRRLDQPHGRRQAGCHVHEDRQIRRNGKQEDAVIDQLVAVPDDGFVGMAHPRVPFTAAGGSRRCGARSTT